MTNPCITVSNSSDFLLCNIFYLTNNKSSCIKTKNINGDYFDHSSYTQIERFSYISDWCMSVIPKDSIIYIEDYAMGARGKVFHIGENTGILKYNLMKKDMKYNVIQPTKIKKFATGKGNADKCKMYEYFYKETKYDLLTLYGKKKTKKIASPISDIVDSYFICKYALGESNVR